MAEADAAHPWDGQNARAQHGHDGAAPQSPDRHDRTAPAGGPDQAARNGHAGEGSRPARPGSEGERRLQRRLGTSERAERFYDEQVLDHLNERMREFVQRQEMFFLATADSHGECDSTFRAGPPGFLQVIDERTLVFPEYRGNGVHASLGNIQENPHLGIMLIDFTRARIGLHINGRATTVEDEEMRGLYPHLPEDPVPGRRAQLWVRVDVEEAYIHCAKHIPQLQRAPKRTARDWGTDDYKRKGGDFFGAARDARERGAATPGATGERGTSLPGDPSAAPARARPEPSPAQAHAGDEATEAAAADEAWKIPEMPPPPALPSLSLGRGSHGTASDPAWKPDAHRTGHSSTTAADGASGAIAARGAVSSALNVGGTDPADWRQEAERALAEAQRRGEARERGTFQGWFG